MMVVELGVSDSVKLVEQIRAAGNGNLTGTIEPGDYNTWRVLRKGAYMIVFSIVGSIAGTIITSMAAAKLIAYVRVFGPELSIAQVSLLIHTLVNMYRTIYLALDPCYTGRWFTGPQAHWQSTITWPAPIITTLLVSLYLRELLSRLTMKGNLRLSNFLTNMRWPFLAICIVIVGLEIANSALRAIRASSLNILVYITAVVYVVIAGLMASFFIYTGSRVVAQQLRASALKESSTGSKSKKNKVRWTFKAIRFILLAAGFLLFWCFSIIFLAINVRNLYVHFVRCRTSVC